MLSSTYGGEEDEHREDLQSSSEHIEGQHDLGKSAERRIVAGRANEMQARADIVEAGKHSREVGLHRESVNGDQQQADKQNDHIGDEIDVGAPYQRFGNDLIVDTNSHNLLRMHDLPNTAM